MKAHSAWQHYLQIAAVALIGVALTGGLPAYAHYDDLAWSADYVFGCDAPSGHVCYFSVADARGHELIRFSLLGGLRNPLLLSAEERLSYTVTVDRDLTDDPTCGAARRAGLFCKTTLVIKGYNN